MSDKNMIVDGIRTGFREAGSGTPLVLVHGLGGPLMWQRVVEPLSRNFHVIAIDLPGFGESGCAAHRLTEPAPHAIFQQPVILRCEPPAARPPQGISSADIGDRKTQRVDR